MELHLGLSLSSSSSSASSQFDLNSNYTCSYAQESLIPVEHLNKRNHDDNYNHVPQTLPLLVWNSFCCNKNKFDDDEEDQDHDDDSDGDDDGGGDNEVQSNLMFVHNRNDGGVIGWPPVKLCRRTQCDRKMGDGGGGGGQADGGGSKSKYVKVHMEGVGIARKVDLNLYNSYQTLVHTLANMFAKRYEDVKLTYQDKEGDWLLAGDVPWGCFIQTTQRLKLLRK